MDIQKQSNVAYYNYIRSEQWRQISARRREIDGNACVMCGCRGTVSNPLQVHHMGYKVEYGKEDIYNDLVTLCYICHKDIHKVMRRVVSPDGRRGWGNQHIPKVSAYVDGCQVSYRELPD